MEQLKQNVALLDQKIKSSNQQNNTFVQRILQNLPIILDKVIKIKDALGPTLQGFITQLQTEKQKYEDLLQQQTSNSAQVDNLNTQLAEATRQLNLANSNQASMKADLIEQIKTLQSKIDQITQQKNMSDTQNVEDKKNLEGDIARLKAELDKTVNELGETNDVKIRDLTKIIEDLYEERNKLNTNTQSINDELLAVTKTVSDLTQDISSVTEEQNTEIASTVEQLQEELDKLFETITGKKLDNTPPPGPPSSPGPNAGRLRPQTGSISSPAYRKPRSPLKGGRKTRRRKSQKGGYDSKRQRNKLASASSGSGIKSVTSSTSSSSSADNLGRGIGTRRGRGRGKGKRMTKKIVSL